MRAFTLEEFPFLIETILLGGYETTSCLPVNEAQALINVIDEARSPYRKPIDRS